MKQQPPPITPLEFEPPDFERAEKFAQHLGYQQTAYSSSSALWGLFCLPENPATARRGQATRGGCIIKTREFGLIFVQDEEDAGYEHQPPAPAGLRKRAGVETGCEDAACGDCYEPEAHHGL